MNGQVDIFQILGRSEEKKSKPKTIRLFEAFSGYGSQSLALDLYNVPYEHVGIAEIDKYAIQAHEALHGTVENFGDVSKLDVNELPDMDMFTYSFPCQDISVAGKQEGFEEGSGTRSSLLWECKRIIEGKLPIFAMMENVKALVEGNNVEGFGRWLTVLENLGYINYWKVVNANDCGIPQNRERVFVISILSEYDSDTFHFEEEFDNGLRLKDMLESNVEDKYYLSDKMIQSFMKPSGKDGTFTFKPKEENSSDYANTLTARMFKMGRTDNYIIQAGQLIDTDSFGGNPTRGRIYDPKGIAPTLNTCGGGGREPKILQRPRGNNKGGLHETCPTITSSSWQDNNHLYDGIRIRKLTPRECGRLMGLTDEQIDKIQALGISNTQQYKMFGNSIVVQQMAFLKNLLL